MPAIVATSMGRGKPRASTRTTLTATGNSIPFVPGQGQILVLHNPTGGSLTPVINGSGNVAAEIEGAGEINFAAGLSLGPIAAGAQILVHLDFIAQYLKGTIDITNGTGLVATLLNR